MTSAAYVDDFTPSLGCLLEPFMGELATQLGLISTLYPREREIVLAQTRESLHGFLHSKLTRLLLLELNAARVTERLSAASPAQRWAEFIDLSSRRSFWDELGEHYPTLQQRVDTIVRNRCATSLLFAQRWAADRDSLAPLCGGAVGELEELTFGAGDSHRGGLTVALVRCQGGRIVYKPRSVAVDTALHRFIADLAQDHGSPLSIRVPKVIEREDYGWAEFVSHKYADGDDELRSFYRGIGHWLAIMHLLAASDLHAENLIANGADPVVVDCETLFTPKILMPTSGFGEALDHASELVAGTVLNIGLLPGRAQTLGWRGIDYSGMGSLPGQQPMMPLPTIVNAGTDEAYLGTTLMPVPIAQNHPSPQPALALYWPQALDAFVQLTDTLQRLDSTGVLEQRLQAFSECRVRVVLRATEAYAEIARMLWHPVSLHNEEQAKQRAFDLLTKMAANVVSAPSDPAVVRAEVEDLLVGDIPFFSTLVRDGQLQGSHGTLWLDANDLAAASLKHWRASDFPFERNVIRAAMVSAYLNDGWTSHLGSLTPKSVRTEDLDVRRRAQAARLMRGLIGNAIHGQDGSVAWVAPVLNPAGWSVQPLGMDLYAGLSGVALLAGAYLRETRAGRADPVDGAEELYSAIQHTLRLAELKLEKTKSSGVRMRPPPLGAYIGLGSQIWTLLVLSEWSGNRDEEIQRACALAEGIADAAASDDMNDILSGRAGAIPPLIMLAAKTGDERFLNMARELGDYLCEHAHRNGDHAYWVHEQMWPKGLGGYSHGVTGVGWALSKLARATGDKRYEEIAQAAFAFEDTLFDAEEQNWVDLRNLGGPKTAAVWCHGSVGIGLAHIDLDPTFSSPRTRPLLRRAAAATTSMGLGWNHCLCHGDLSAWELLERATVLGEAPGGLTSDELLAQVLSSIEEHGPSCGLTKEVYVPGLLPGLGGVAYQLLKAHPDSHLPSVLTIGSDGF